MTGIGTGYESQPGQCAMVKSAGKATRTSCQQPQSLTTLYLCTAFTQCSCLSRSLKCLPIHSITVPWASPHGTQNTTQPTKNPNQHLLHTMWKTGRFCSIIKIKFFFPVLREVTFYLVKQKYIHNSEQTVIKCLMERYHEWTREDKNNSLNHPGRLLQKRQTEKLPQKVWGKALQKGVSETLYCVFRL